MAYGQSDFRHRTVWQETIIHLPVVALAIENKYQLTPEERSFAIDSQ
ncbi:hypothetical protein EV06_1071 [Prochlorococcus sp. MIT 0602]|nr:hypothetical protein EV06_1071 [Prochlorococcus sp. MIT 0602]KGG17477.1 hypothetical protein EV07_0917 [Prochlorococcus sp. MIT 0603]